ncbi:MAG TPA: methyltransferase domain-containing protein [Thermomicrobiaceae bacterium]|nr:methyltransferase domain-containing protein [Thermomicrobiaceae bacterium]
MTAEYTFDNAWVQARERLALMESAFDPGSIRHLEQLGVRDGWHCLEVGAGGGSIASWLCRKVGPSGHVIATDLDTRFLERLDFPNLAVHRHDVASEPLPESAFDLVHCRLLLMHLPERERALHAMVNALKPGGWLLVEEAGEASAPPDSGFEGAALFNRGTSAFIEIQARAGVDWTYGRRLYGDIRAAGLHDLDGEGRVSVVAAGTLSARGQQLSLAQQRDRIVGAGLLTEEEMDRFLALFDDPGLVTIGITLMAVWGRKPL